MNNDQYINAGCDYGLQDISNQQLQLCPKNFEACMSYADWNNRNKFSEKYNKLYGFIRYPITHDQDEDRLLYVHESFRRKLYTKIYEKAKNKFRT